jgi:hypothetical protein
MKRPDVYYGMAKVFENEAKQLCRQLGIFFVRIGLVERESERDRKGIIIYKTQGDGTTNEEANQGAQLNNC